MNKSKRNLSNNGVVLETFVRLISSLSISITKPVINSQPTTTYVYVAPHAQLALDSTCLGRVLVIVLLATDVESVDGFDPKCPRPLLLSTGVLCYPTPPLTKIRLR